MEWFSRKTSIAGVQVPNWMVVLGAIICNLDHLFIHSLTRPLVPETPQPATNSIRSVRVASRTMKYGVRLVDDPRRREAARCHVCRRAHDARSLPTSAVLTQTGRRGGFGRPFYRLMRIRGMSSSSTAACHILFCVSCSKRCRKVRRSSRRNAATRSSGLSLISRGLVSQTICSASRILPSMLDLIGPGPSAISDSSSLLKNPRHGESVVIQFSVTNRRRLACGAHL